MIPVTMATDGVGDRKMTGDGWVRAANVSEMDDDGCRVVQLGEHTIALFQHDGQVFAIDNRCPHMGFPLSQGSVKCGILTCHWHHARFDLRSGGTFDPWADDVMAYPTRVNETTGEIFVDLSPPQKSADERFRRALENGLRNNLRLIVGKAVIGLSGCEGGDKAALEAGARFGTEFARNGWGSGMTILTAMANILPQLSDDDRPRALYQGLSQVGGQVAGQPPAFLPDPLPTDETRPDVFLQWFREFVEVRNRDGAQRTLLTAVAAGLPMPAIAEIVFTAATDHRYLSGGHTMDFCNKAFELLDLIGWEGNAAPVLASLVPVLTGSSRSEESGSWRHPIDLVALLDSAFAEMPERIVKGEGKRGTWSGRGALVETLLTDDPVASVSALLSAVEAGATAEQLAGAVAFAAARRIAQFRTSNEFGDWITVLHTFTYANAMHQAIRRVPDAPALLRGVFDGAISVYLDRFLNMPPAPLPRPEGTSGDSRTAGERSAALLELMNTQQQVSEAARLVSDWLTDSAGEDALLEALGQALLREDAEFHTFQCVEAGFRQYADLRGTDEGRVVLVAVARYLASHSPTPRATGQTYQIALRLHRGEELYAE